MRRRAMLGAGLLAAAAMMTGCTAETRPAATPTAQAMQQQTAQPSGASNATVGEAPDETAAPDETGSPDEMPEPDEEKVEKLALLIDGNETEAGAVKENGDLLLPLMETGEALGWKAKRDQTQEETQTKHQIALEKDGSRITVSYEVSDNTIRRISWQKDGLLVPVDTRIETIGDTVYVPAAFFEEATGAKIVERGGSVEVSSPEPMDTPQINQ